jgi:type IV pilus assembly protein PilC
MLVEVKAYLKGMLIKKVLINYIALLLKAGESAGILDTILNKLSEFMEKQEAIKKQIKKALTYPTIVVIIGIGVTWGLMVFVVPQFVGNA